MPLDTFLIEIRSPDGTWTDVTDYTDLDAMSGFSYGIEDDLLQFRTGELTLTLSDHDGVISALFAGADPTLTYGLRVSRNGTKLFEGIMALPGQAKSSLGDAALELTAFGYLALLDQISAETITRSFLTTDTATGTTATDTLTLIPGVPAGLTQDDTLRLSSETISEEVAVRNIINSTQIRLKANLANTWGGPNAAALVEYTSPFYRRKTPTFLVQQLFAAAGIANPTIDLTGTEFALPVATPMNSDGLDTTFAPTSATEVAGKLRLRIASPTSEYEATDGATGGFVVAGTSVGAAGDAKGYPIVDWHLYQLTEPATNVTSVETDGTSNAQIAFGGIDYSLSPPRRWGLRLRTAIGGGGGGVDRHHIELVYYDWNTGTKTWGSPTVIIGDTAVDSDDADLGLTGMSCELDSVRRWTYFCYATPSPVIQERLRYIDIAGGGITTLKNGTGASGTLRYSREAGLMLHLNGTTLTGYDGATIAFQATVPTGVKLRTARYLASAGKWVIVALERDRTKLVVADRLFTTQISLAFSESASRLNAIAGDPGDDSNNFLGHFQALLVGRVDGQYVVIDSLYAGVISYADFTGMTIATALTELAKLINTVPYVDNDFNGFFISRSSSVFNPAGEVKAIDELLLSQEEDLVWEKWYGRVTVTSPSGFTATLGDASLSASELSLSSDFIPNLSVTSALTYAYLAFYSRARRTRRINLDDDDTIYLPLLRVTMGAEEWVIYEIDPHWGEREVALRLVEAT